MERRRMLLLSGAVAAGKSTFAEELIKRHGYVSIRSGAYLRSKAAEAGLDASRTGLQDLGDQLDSETDYAWLIDDVAAPLINGQPSQVRWLLDAVRKPRQVEHFRRRFGEQVMHVHLTAPEQELQRRYEERLARGGEYLGSTPYVMAVAHPNEVAARSLEAIADLVLDTSETSALDQLNRALAA